jgi:histidinol-phosphate aminotransferase
MDAMTRVHGGPDARGPARWDFSTNAVAGGACPVALQALRRADPRHYPDPGYQALREALAAWHGVAPSRVLVAASASEFIQRITAVGQRLRPGAVAVPVHAYGDYAAAARATGRAVVHGGAQATLRWCCDPSSPLGEDAPPPGMRDDCTTVLDSVYAPLRLDGESPWTADARDAVFTLHSPNKALGLTGIRAAYVIAPRASWADAWVRALDAAAPSWPLGAHGVALLQAWVTPEAGAWLARRREQLRAWKRAQLDMLQGLGAEVRPSRTNFFCARWPMHVTPAALRTQGIAVRDAASFGLPGWVRLSVQPPAAQRALVAALTRGDPK